MKLIKCSINFLSLIFTICAISCNFFTADVSTENTENDLEPNSPHYVTKYLNMDESITNPGIFVPNKFINTDGNETISWKVNEPKITTSLIFSDFYLELFAMWEPNESNFTDDIYYHWEWGNDVSISAEYLELAELYNDTNYSNNNNYGSFNHYCPTDPIVSINVYAEPTYINGYDSIAINDFVDITFLSAREYIKNGYSYYNTEQLLSGSNRIIKTLNEFNSSDNYLLGLETLQLQLTEPPTNSGEYTFTIVYKDRDQNGVIKEIVTEIGPIPITVD